MSVTVIPYARFLEVVERRQRVAKELKRRSGTNVSLWQLIVGSTPKPAASIRKAGDGTLITIPDPVFS